MLYSINDMINIDNIPYFTSNTKTCNLVDNSQTKICAHRHS